MFDFLFNNTKKNAPLIVGQRILLDLGGTKMRIARVHGDSFVDVRIVPTPRDPGQGVVKLIELARALAASKKIESVTGCMAGRVDPSGVISDARNLPAWEGKNIIERLTQALHCRVTIVNDGALVGLGEAIDGAGVGSSVMAYITISTGVGGALIREGQIDFDASTFAVGRIPIDGSDLEKLVSGTAVFQKYGIEPSELDSIDERNRIADYIARGLLDVVKQWSPDTIVLGGSMMVGKRNTIPLGRIDETLTSLIGGVIPTLKLAKLQDLGGFHGALAYANAKLQ